MELHSVHDAGMGFRVINDHVLAVDDGLDQGNHALVSEIEQVSRFFAHKFSDLFFKLFMINCLAGHHPGAHLVSETKFCCRFRIGFPDFRVVGQSKIIVQAPYQPFLALVHHSAGDFPFQFREKIISVPLFVILAQWPHFRIQPCQKYPQS